MKARSSNSIIFLIIIITILSVGALSLQACGGSDTPEKLASHDEYPIWLLNDGDTAVYRELEIYEDVIIKHIIVSNLVDSTQNGLQIVESIPKEIAGDVSELVFSEPPVVLESDPLVMWQLGPVGKKKPKVIFSTKRRLEKTQCVDDTKALSEMQKVYGLNPFYPEECAQYYVLKDIEATTAAVQKQVETDPTTTVVPPEAPAYEDIKKECEKEIPSYEEVMEEIGEPAADTEQELPSAPAISLPQGWDTYEHGSYSCGYPSSWTKIPPDKDNLLLEYELIDDDITYDYQLMAMTTEGQSLSDYVKAQKMNDPDLIEGTITEETVGTTEAYLEVERSVFGWEVYYELQYTVYGDTVYLIQMITIVENQERYTEGVQQGGMYFDTAVASIRCAGGSSPGPSESPSPPEPEPPSPPPDEKITTWETFEYDDFTCIFPANWEGASPGLQDIHIIAAEYIYKGAKIIYLFNMRAFGGKSLQNIISTDKNYQPPLNYSRYPNITLKDIGTDVALLKGDYSEAGFRCEFHAKYVICGDRVYSVIIYVSPFNDSGGEEVYEKTREYYDTAASGMYCNS